MHDASAYSELLVWSKKKKQEVKFFAKSPLMMDWFSVLVPTLLILSLSATHTFATSIQFPNHNSPSEAGALLLGDAHFVGDENAVQLNRPTPSSSGVMFTNTHFNFSSSTSLSTHFTFQIGNSIALVIIPAHFPLAKNMSFELINANRFLGIEFIPNVCSISVSRVSNVSKSVNELKDGVKLSAWIDYRAILKRLDVRLTKLGDSKPVEPLISYRVDLGEILKGGEVLLGLVSFNGNRERVAYVYSWSSEVKDVPKWMHSIPVDPKKHSAVQASKENGSVVSGFFFATGCGLLAASVMFLVWSYVVDWRKAQQETSVCPIDFKYEKIDVVEVKNSEAAMK
ncbi:hypothetical protein QVD17_35926 [Tagetes erecta]|uniref:Legume lectin domain-containing protein n=1 Tax=Tagetes erecta TaxID=13708 RepID=A0AAD8JRE1_TARER|nr:hypothetical protein QVD17_35926 [Tagetes erecta]